MFFYLSKILSFFIHPANIVFIALIFGVVLLWTKWRKLGHYLLATTAVFALFFTVLPVGNAIRAHLENRFPLPTSLPNTIDGIIVLGGAVNPGLSNDRKQLNVNASSERLLIFAQLAKTYPKAKLIYSGGSGSLTDTHLKEAYFARNAITIMGVKEDRVIFENRSRNTVENALYSKELGQPTSQENWILITSAQHMPRAVGCFRKVGWKTIPYPVDYTIKTDGDLNLSINFGQTSSGLAHGLHEVMGLFAYWITGKTDKLYPEPR